MYNSPFCVPLTKFIEPEVTYQFSSVKTVTIRANRFQDGYDIIIACERAALDALRKNIKGQLGGREKRTEKEWERLLAETYQKCDEVSRQNIHSFLGCPLVNVILRADAQPGPKVKDGQQSWLEMEEFLRLFKGESKFFASHPALCFRESIKDQWFFPAWSKDDDGKLDEARKLFRQGKNLPQILHLICDSIAINPIDEEKWRYLGGALMACNQPKDAAIAYVQALRLMPQNFNAWEGLLKACAKAGWTKHAEGLRWFLRINP